MIYNVVLISAVQQSRSVLYIFICRCIDIPGGTSGKEPSCQCRRHKRRGFDPWVGKILWRRAWQPTPVFLLGESHRQRSLVGYCPWGHKELDMTEATSFFLILFSIMVYHRILDIVPCTIHSVQHRILFIHSIWK